MSGKGLGVARPQSPGRSSHARHPAAKARRGGRSKSGLSFMERLEERWRRRQEGGR